MPTTRPPRMMLILENGEIRRVPYQARETVYNVLGGVFVCALAAVILVLALWLA